MTMYEKTTTHTAEAIQYVAPTGPDDGNVAEIQELCPEAVEQESWNPALGQSALVIGDASLANTEWLLLFEDGSTLVLDDEDFTAAGYKAVEAEPPATPAPKYATGGVVTTPPAKSASDDTTPNA